MSNLPNLHQLLALTISFSIGGLVGFIGSQHFQQPSIETGSPLRSQNYSLVKPLLFNDFDNEETSIDLLKSQQEVVDLINNYKSTGQLYQASVYYRHLQTGQQMIVNNNEKYNPASLIKLPLAMAYYKLSETDSHILSDQGQIRFDHDKNVGQEILPNQAPVSEGNYSIRQLLDFMLKASDNNSFSLLMTNSRAVDSMRQLFADVRLYFPDNSSDNIQIFTAKEFSRFYRLLFNATYLSPQQSEGLLDTLTQTEYANGLVAGLPQNMKVAHKFGLGTERSQDGQLTGRQLHDCGIVYSLDSPYLVCIMTKSTTPELKSSEQIVKALSEKVYIIHQNIVRQP